MVASFLVVPQWQGSVSSRAMNAASGAEAIRGDLPSKATHVVEVPAEAGDSLGTGVKRFSALVRVRDLIAEALAPLHDPVITIGGDCGVSLAPVERANRGGDVALVWVDAHPDIHTPESSASGGFTGMALRAIMGDGVTPLRATAESRVPAERIVLAGVRDPDAAEARYIAHHQFTNVPATEFANPRALADAVRATGATRVYVHIDVDALDPSALTAVTAPVPFGYSSDELTTQLRTLVAEFDLAGATIAGFAPASAAHATDDLPVILRLIASLTSGRRTS